jgi:hypothetical protein
LITSLTQSSRSPVWNVMTQLKQEDTSTRSYAITC